MYIDVYGDGCKEECIDVVLRPSASSIYAHMDFRGMIIAFRHAIENDYLPNLCEYSSYTHYRPAKQRVLLKNTSKRTRSLEPVPYDTQLNY